VPEANGARKPDHARAVRIADEAEGSSLFGRIHFAYFSSGSWADLRPDERQKVISILKDANDEWWRVFRNEKEES